MISRTVSDASWPAGGPSLAARILLLAVDAYRVALSPLLGGFCRYWPSCSVYAQALLAVRRLGRCHPFHPGGYDPVP